MQGKAETRGRAGGAAYVVPGPGGVRGCGDCVRVCVFMGVRVRGDLQNRAWIWVSIHTGSRVIAGLHPASWGSSGPTASGLDPSDTHIPQVSCPTTMPLTSHRGPENIQTQERGVSLHPPFPLILLTGFKNLQLLGFIFKTLEIWEELLLDIAYGGNVRKDNSKYIIAVLLSIIKACYLISC